MREYNNSQYHSGMSKLMKHLPFEGNLNVTLRSCWLAFIYCSANISKTSTHQQVSFHNSCWHSFYSNRFVPVVLFLQLFILLCFSHSSVLVPIFPVDVLVTLLIISRFFLSLC